MKRSLIALAGLLILVAAADAGQFQYRAPKRKHSPAPRIRGYRNEDYPGKELLKRQIAEAELRVAEAKVHLGTKSYEYKAARADLRVLRDRQRMENLLHRKPKGVGY